MAALGLKYRVKKPQPTDKKSENADKQANALKNDLYDFHSMTSPAILSSASFPKSRNPDRTNVA
jgi:hypothetical protein